MALYKLTAKKTGTYGRVRFEKGMSIEVVLQGAYSSSDSIKKIKEAWRNKYNIDLENLYGSSYLNYEKIN
jgi:hypothetical protein